MSASSDQTAAQQHQERAILLIQHGRHEQALQELQQSLAGDPNNGRVHGLMAACLLDLDRVGEAQQQAEQAIQLSPNDGFGHGVLASVLLNRNRYAEAEEAAQRTVDLNPTDAWSWATLARVHASRQRWEAARQAAAKGLEFDPEDERCLNLHALALMKLGRQDQAQQMIQETLAKNPEDSDSHAAMGWSLLHQNRPKQALEHFRLALQADAQNDWAKAGLVEALKARNFLYRGMLSYFLWMSRLPAGTQWVLVIGGVIGVRLLRGAAREMPALQPLVLPIVGLYVGFVVLTWLSDPLFNLFLRLDRFGKYALSSDQRWGANMLGCCLVAGAAFLGVGLFLQSAPLVWLAVVSGLLSLPASSIFKCTAGKPRWAMAGFTAVLAIIGLLPGLDLVAPQWGWGDSLLGPAFFLGIILSTWVGNLLQSWEPRR